MSAHYSTREASGCVGCVAAMGSVLVVLGATAYACWWIAGRLTGSAL